jgi:hypothetical protein
MECHTYLLLLFMLLLERNLFNSLHVLVSVLHILVAAKLVLLQVAVLISLPNPCLGQQITQQVVYCRTSSLT